MKHEILIIGRGGQGILLLGKILGEALTLSGLNVVAMESYGAETRGTESRVEMIVSDNPEGIDFVKVRKPNIGVILYPFNLEKNLSKFIEGSILILDSINVKELPITKSSWRIYSKPFTDIAEKKIGTSRVVNMVVLGYLINKTKLAKPEVVEEAIKNSVDEKWVSPNIKAFREGLNIAD
ncbi:MAG: 2-oxoacid:acceptor oxidoreductase family protein [Desulfurococcaceae archaeon]